MNFSNLIYIMYKVYHSYLRMLTSTGILFIGSDWLNVASKKEPNFIPSEHLYEKINREESKT